MVDIDRELAERLGWRPGDVEVNETGITAAVGARSGMVALRPSDPDELVVAGGDPPEELHVTLAFLGDDVPDEMQAKIRDAARDVAAQFYGPMRVTVAGYGVLGSEDAVVLFLNGDLLGEVHARLWQSIDPAQLPAQHAPWLPHLTLGYGIDIRKAKRLQGREFDVNAITVDVGESHDRFVLGGDDAVSLLSRGDREASVTEAFQEEGSRARWRGVMVVEDTPTGDGRQFAADALTWPDLPLPLQWQKETSHGGINDVTVTVGTIESIERDGNQIIGEGFIDLGSEDGRDVYRRILPAEQGGLGLGGVSIVADDPEQAEVEYVYPEGCDLEEKTPEEIDEIPLEELEKCFLPELVIFHSGRIRALTVVDTPAFVEARIDIVDDEAEVTAAVSKLPVQVSVNGHSYDIGEVSSPDEIGDLLAEAATRMMNNALAFTPVASHETGTSDDPWDASANEGRLESPMSVDTAENMYGWLDREQVEDGEIAKTHGKFPHHNVGDNGQPGAANVQGARSGISVLNGARGGADIPSGDREGVYNHLARHIRDAGEEPPELRSADELVEVEVDGRTFLVDPDAVDEELVAAAWTVTIPDLPPLEWFTEPSELPPIGAINVTPEGRLYGLLAPKGVAHRAIRDRRQEVPTGNVDYSRFMSRPTPVAMADGSVEKIPTGVITMNCGHAKPVPSINSDKAMEHYDNSCSVVATVRVGENRHGVWVAGALMPGIETDDLARLLACQLSGDWRPHPEHPGMRELTAALLVPQPAFVTAGPTIRLDQGELVAASAPVHFQPMVAAITATDDTTVKQYSARDEAPAEDGGADDTEQPTDDKDAGRQQPDEYVDTETEAGGKPSKGTPKDRRLKKNRDSGTEDDVDAETLGSEIHDGYVDDLPDFGEALRVNDPKVRAAEIAAEIGRDRQTRLAELVASVKG